MGKRFVPVHDADKRAIRLYKQLTEIVEKIRSIRVAFTKDGKKIVLVDRDDGTAISTYTVDEVLSFDVQQAVQGGGTWDALINSRRQIGPRVSQAEIDEGVRNFLSENDD